MSAPVIIIGTGRSGTSELHRLFEYRFRFAMAFEPNFGKMLRHRELPNVMAQRRELSRIWKRVRADDEHLAALDVEDALARVEQPTPAGLLKAALASEAARQNKTRYGWKSPADSVRLLQIATALPDAKFIHILRNAHDTAASLVSKSWGPKHLYTAARYWNRVVQAIWAQQRQLPGRVLELRFEELWHDNPSAAVHRLAEFVGLKDRARIDDALDYITTRQRPHKIREWQRNMSKDGRRYVEAAAQKSLLESGYETEYGGQARVTATERAVINCYDVVTRIVNRAKLAWKHGRPV